MGAMCSPQSVKRWRTPSALSMRARSCAPVDVAMAAKSIARAGRAHPESAVRSAPGKERAQADHPGKASEARKREEPGEQRSEEGEDGELRGRRNDETGEHHPARHEPRQTSDDRTARDEKPEAGH